MARRDCGCDDDYFQRSRRRNGSRTGATVDPKENLYKSTLMKHYRAMDYRRVLAEPYIESQQVNRSCGDRIKLQFKIDADWRVLDAAYQGEGCSICIASAAMLCDSIRGLTMQEGTILALSVIGMLESQDETIASQHFQEIAEKLGTSEPDILSLWSVRAFGARIPCALLSWNIIPTLLEKPGS